MGGFAPHDAPGRGPRQRPIFLRALGESDFAKQNRASAQKASRQAEPAV